MSLFSSVNTFNYVEEHPSLILNGLKISRGLSGSDFFKKLRKLPAEEAVLEGVIKIKAFNEHWDYASGQIYFDSKFPEDTEKAVLSSMDCN